jgi:peptidoglycan hydrolase-like protein with peptidoglycan-binding domain
MIVSALALGATVFAGGSLSPNTPAAEAAGTPTCSTYNTFTRSGIRIIVPTASGAVRKCLVTSRNPGGSLFKPTYALQLGLAYGEGLISILDPTWRTDGVDGRFGQKTYQAVRNVQARYRIAVDGDYGPNTHNKIVFCDDSGMWCIKDGAI